MKTAAPAKNVRKEPLPLRLFNSVRRRVRVLLLLLVLSVAVASLYAVVQVPVYQAVATIELDLQSRPGQTIENVVEFLGSRTLAEQVAQRMNLAWQVVDQSAGLDVQIGRFLVTGTIPGLLIRLETPPGYRIFDLSGRFLGSGLSGQPFVAAGVDLLLDIRQGQAGQELVLEHRSLEAHIETLVGAVRVVAVGANSNLIRVFSQATDPHKARDVANLLVETYREELLGQQRGARQAIDQQLEQTRAALAAVQAELQDLQRRTGFSGQTPSGEPLATAVTELQQLLRRQTAQRERIDQALEQLTLAHSQETGLTPSSIDGSPEIAAAANRLLELQSRKRQLLVDFTERHPEVVDVQEAIRQARRTLLVGYTEASRALSAEIASLRQQLADAVARLEQLPQADWARLTELRQTHSQVLESLLQRQRDLQLEQALTDSQVRVIDPALTPDSPVWPDIPLILFIGAAAGLGLGFCACLFLSLSDRRFNTIEDIQAGLALPILGVIPRIPDAVVQDGIPVAVQMPKAPVVEAFRALRTRLHALTGKANHQIILVTSSLPGEGKSTISTNLSVVLSLTGARVLLIGCDLRRPTLHEKFGQTNVPGLVDLLKDSSQDALRHIASPRLDFLPAGTLPDNPAEILDSEQMRTLLTLLARRYDYVVIDAPPVLPVTDAQILAPLADITLAVLEPCRVPEDAARQMVASLQAVGAAISGLVINDRTGRGFKYYGSYSYYGNRNYSGYYGEHPDDLVDGPVLGGIKKLWQSLNP